MRGARAQAALGTGHEAPSRPAAFARLARVAARAWLAPPAVLLVAAAACSPASRDVVPETRDVRASADLDAGAANRSGGSADAYAWVARRAHGAVGLAGARHVDGESAKRIVERLADELDACAARLQAEGTLVEGAARFVAATGARGTGELGEMQLAPGSAVAANALLCIAAPVRATTFPPAGSEGVPALLLEASWSPLRGARRAPDAGPPADRPAATPARPPVTNGS